MLAPVERVLAERAAANPLPLARVGLAAAVALHLALVAFAVLGPRLAREERQPLEFMPVALVPAQALGTGRPPPSPPQQDPAPVAVPEPPAAEEAPAAEPEREPVMPAPTPTERPRQPEPEPERQRPAPSRPAEAPPADPAPRQPPAGSDDRQAGRPGDRPGSPLGSPEGTSGLGARLAGVGDPSFTYGYYLDRMLALIERNWRRPPTGDALPEVALTFRIQRDGRVGDLEIETSSGSNAFDLAGLRAVENAAPLPPLPAGYRKESLSIRLIIR
ncbi:MAG TPA: TonB family protein [Thermoanaerobaculia bacterium]|nr:TonB family protein [Thermoanaerobaculia bacterium]